jgi:MFS family permease
MLRCLKAMPGFLRVFGYPDPHNPIGYGIDSTVQQLIASLLTLGSFVSALLAGSFATYFGRRHGLWCACILNAVACAIQIGTDSVGALYVGRLLLGIANGFLVTFSNVYTAEASPAHLRGIIVALFAYWVNIGAILGAVVVNYTKSRIDKNAYRIPLACLYIVPTILAIGLFLVPESPRWLLHKGREAEARRAFETLRGSTIGREDTELEWSEMLRGVEEEKRNANGVSWMDMFRGMNTGNSCHHR